MTIAQTEIISSSLDAIAWEMIASLIRTAYSPNIKERADCSTAIVSIDARTLALATYAPAHLGSTLRLANAILERFPKETLRPGDIFFANDPYIVGVTHLNDCTAVAPVFIDGEPVAFVAAVAHHSDVGGRVPGSEAGDSTSIMQEGLRIPPVLLYEAGRLRSDIWELFLLNSRTPHYCDGDLHAQTAALKRGGDRLVEMYAKYGSRKMQVSIAEMIEATAQRARQRISDVLRPGTYYAEDWLDEDGVSDNPVKLAVTCTIKDGKVHFDFSNCAKQLGSGKNVPLTHTMAVAYFCIKMMVDPDLPINEGMYRSISMEAPIGSVVNPVSPGGVSSRNLTGMILADVIMDALGQATPSRAFASGGPYQGIILSGTDPRTNRFFVDYENFAGGQGAWCEADGNDVIQVQTTNTNNLPIEVMEAEFPVLVEKYEVVADSGGAGKFRGGLGVCRDLRILCDDGSLTVRSARQRFAAKGIAGGKAGTLGSFILNPGTANEKKLGSTFSEMPLRKGDVLRIVSPGGGGHGEPGQRDRALINRDLREEKITRDSAQIAYGVKSS